ncbi:hypothetical protein [Secundilactobacillus silagei]|uniref:hypothetical protein n=1 Tax=Secundilactobacillus silagei TaxID=1293415 RepID=UPI000B0654C6|nr:hypothetical protein [Secundilactobacillus silagei]
MPKHNEAQKIQTLKKARVPLIVWMIMIGFVALSILSTSAFTIGQHLKIFF